MALPTDCLGRRWHLRIHELRKSFLITFFWCSRFQALDAARWVAGHTRSEHIYAYIQANFPGEELPKIEAEYAQEQIWNFESGDPGETDNVETLYKAVCNHFGVGDISLIDAEELSVWLNDAFESGLYKIEPYTIERDGTICTAIAFKITEGQDET